MVKLEDINFTKVKDKEILAIDFTNTVTKIQVKKGDNIIVSKYSGTEVKYEGTDYIIVKQDDILAIVE